MCEIIFKLGQPFRGGCHLLMFSIVSSEGHFVPLSKMVGANLVDYSVEKYKLTQFDNF